MAKEFTYSQQRALDLIRRTRELLSELPPVCADYIRASESFPSAVSTSAPVSGASTAGDASGSASSELQYAIIKGLKDKAGDITKEMLSSVQPMDIVRDEIIPSLNTVGEGFEQKKVYLPQLLMSAEAAKSAFESIKDYMASHSEAKESVKKGPFVIATVHGDIHDIGKNIVKLLLENYGFDVIDLGKDVPPERIVDTVLSSKAPLAGLSALMTTTVPAMEETIKLLREKAPFCKVVVGGAVLTKEYADKIGADKYAKDAMETVRYAESIC